MPVGDPAALVTGNKAQAEYLRTSVNTVSEMIFKSTQNYFESSAEFSNLREDLLKILDSDERIPFVSKSGDYFYNFWRDKDHERGIWRRTTLEEYRKDDPAWEILLDLDELAEDEEGEEVVMDEEDGEEQ